MGKKLIEILKFFKFVKRSYIVKTAMISMAIVFIIDLISMIIVDAKRIEWMMAYLIITVALGIYGIIQKLDENERT